MRETDTVRGCSAADGVGSVVLTNGEARPDWLSISLVAAKQGAPLLPSESNPLHLMNIVLVVLSLVIAGLLIIAVVRAPTWARHRVARHPLVGLRLVPLIVVAIAGLLVAPVLFGYGAAGFAIPYWLGSWAAPIWLLPLVAIVSATMFSLGVTALTRRIWSWRHLTR